MMPSLSYNTSVVSEAGEGASAISKILSIYYCKRLLKSEAFEELNEINGWVRSQSGKNLLVSTQIPPLGSYR
jgi:hypothetical protein